MATITWLSNKGHSCVLTINNGTSSVLQPSSSPFTTEGDSDEDFFKPIRCESGEIGIMGGPTDLENIIGDNPLDRPVSLSVDGSVVWKGFLQSSSYSQDWIVGPNNIKIPVVSPLSLIGSLSIEVLHYYVNVAEFLVKLNNALLSPWTHFVFPSRITLSKLTSCFTYDNYASFDDETQTYSMATYNDVLEDICNVFGFQCSEHGEYLIFTSMDCQNDFIDLTAEELDELADVQDVEGTEVAGSTISQSTLFASLCSDDHTIDYIPGKRSVSVSYSFNRPEETLISISADSCSIGASINAGSYVNNTRYFIISRLLVPPSNVTIPGNVDVRDLSVEAATDKTGSGLVSQMFCFVTSDNEKKGDSSLTTRVFSRGTGSIALISFSPLIDYQYNVLTQDAFFSLNFSVNTCSSWSKELDGFTGKIYICMKVGNYYYNVKTKTWSTEYTSNYAYFDGGSFKYFVDPAKNEISVLSNQVFYGSGIIFPCPKINGKITVSIFKGDVSANDYVSLENISLKQVVNWTIHGSKGEQSDSRSASETIGNGFLDDYEVDSNLTCCEISNGEYGNGCLLNYSQTAAVTSFLPSMEYPEVDYCARLKTYFSKTRRKISVTLNSNGSPFDIKNYYCVDATRNYCIVAQSINWYSDEDNVTFLEIP